MVLSVLGQDYDYEEIPGEDDPKMEGFDGYCDSYGKIIRINSKYSEKAPNCVGDLEAYRRTVRRHEIIHAFFSESGLTEYNTDEVLVDWLALQFIKLEKAFQAVGAL
jgi:hypothetical protein